MDHPQDPSSRKLEHEAFAGESQDHPCPGLDHLVCPGPRAGRRVHRRVLGKPVDLVSLRLVELVSLPRELEAREKHELGLLLHSLESEKIESQ